MADYSNLVKLGIVSVDPGSILGRPSAGLYEPLRYAPLNEPLQRPDFAGITVPPLSGNDTYVGSGKGKQNKKASKGQEASTKNGKLRKFNWKKFLGITSVVVLATFGLHKLAQKFPNALNKAGEWLKKIPDHFKKTP